jgi:hypothetical protein
MNFEIEMETYFKLETLNERKEKIKNILSKLETDQIESDPVNNLNIAEALIEYCLLIENNDERLQRYDKALELILDARLILKEKDHITQFLRSYHLDCFIKFHIMKYKDEEAAIHDMNNFGLKIIEQVAQIQKNNLYDEYNEYYSLGCVWSAQGLYFNLVQKSKELSFEEKHSIIEKIINLAHKAVELSKNTKSRDAHILSAYVYAYAEQLPHLTLGGDKATTEEDFLTFMYSFDILFEIAKEHGSIEFEYLALLNIVRLKLLRVIYAAGVSEKKGVLFKEILDDCKKLEEYENKIRMPHLHFYRYVIQSKVYTSFIYFETVQEENFEHYINEALKSAEQLRYRYVSGGMQGAREKVEMHHLLNETYRMKASFTSSRAEKLEYLKKSEDLLLEDEKISASWSPKDYMTWRDLSSVFLDMSKVEHDHEVFKKCVFYAKKSYEAALAIEDFTDALFEAYKIALIGEDYQEYDLSVKYYDSTLLLVDKIIKAGKDYPYYHDLKTYLQARLQGVKAKDAHRKGEYAQAMILYSKASSLLQSHALYSYEALLYNAYSLFEEASIRFIDEEYKKTLEVLSNIIHLFDETTKHHAGVYEPQFQYFMDRRAYDLQELFFDISKTFCIAQSYILQSLIYRNSGESKRAVELLKKTNTLLAQFNDRDIHITGYYLFTNGLFGLEQSELAIRSSEYKSAAAYLATASEQFENASQVLSSDEGLRKLCEGLKFFCEGWMYALELLRRGRDHTSSELEKNYIQAHQSLTNATRKLKMFKKTFSSVHGFDKLLSYFSYSLLLQKSDDPAEKSILKDKMIEVLNEALNYFTDAEDMERYGFTRDLLANLPQLEKINEKVFKPIIIPFTPYTPVFDTTSKVEFGDVKFTVQINKNRAEVNQKLVYTIRITSDVSAHVIQIEGLFPKKDMKVISGMRLAKEGTVKIDRLLSPGQSIEIEFSVRALKPLYSRKHPQLIYFTAKNEKYRAFTTPITLQIYPKNVLTTGVVNEFNKRMHLVKDIVNELDIDIGEFPIIFHNLDSYRENLSEYLSYGDSKDKRKHSKKLRLSQLPIQKMAFVDPLGDVNILYDLDKHLYPHSIASILNMILHEKFGHGFFYQHTTLGKKLFELEYHRKGITLLMNDLKKISNKYAIGIQWLCMSTLIPNEGFAMWLTSKTFEKTLEKISEDDMHFTKQLNYEIESIKKRITSNNDLNVKHEYFTLKYGNPVVNPYAMGLDLFLQIEEKYGDKCVPKALEIATDIPLTRSQISRMQQIVTNDKNCADKRLEIIASSQPDIKRNDVKEFEIFAKELIKK